jgi:hypothetical protein
LELGQQFRGQRKENGNARLFGVEKEPAVYDLFRPELGAVDDAETGVEEELEENPGTVVGVGKDFGNLAVGEGKRRSWLYFRCFNVFRRVLCEPVVLDAEGEECPESFDLLAGRERTKYPCPAKFSNFLTSQPVKASVAFLFGVSGKVSRQ